MSDEFLIEEDENEDGALDGDDVSDEMRAKSRAAHANIEGSVFGLFDSLGVKLMSVDDMREIVRARTGTLLDRDDPMTVALVALDTAMRHYTEQFARLHVMGGELLDRNADKVVEGVGLKIDQVAEAAVKAIRENSAAVEGAVQGASKAVEDAKRTMLRVTATAKVLLAVTGGVAATVVTAVVVAGLFAAGILQN